MRGEQRLDQATYQAMKTQRSNISSLPWARAFTLIELLVVVAVMTILMALAGLTVPASMASQQLGGIARQLTADLDHAALLAKKDSQPVEVRFYKFPDKDGLGEKQYRAYQLAKIVGWSGDGSPQLKFVSDIQKMSGGIILMPDPKYSTLLTKTPVKNTPTDPDLGYEYEYVSYLIRPDGRTNLPRASKTVFTLIQEKPGAAALTTLPADYRSVVMDPVTGAVSLF